MRVACLLLAGTLLLGACTTARPIAAVSPPPQPARCTLVPWIESGKPIVRATLNGRELTFLVDSGAEYDGWIKPDLAKELGLPVVGTVPPEEGEDATAGLPFYGVRSVTLGGLGFSDRKFGELNFAGPKPLPFDGIIGNGLFEQMQVVFDYGANTLLATDRVLTDGETWPFEHGIPAITLMVGQHPVTVHLDTGNVASELAVTADDAARLAKVGEPVARGKAMSVAGPIDAMEANLADKVMFGATVLPVTKVRWPGAFGDGQLGSRGLAGQIVRIDRRNGKVTIRPEGVPARCD